MCDPAGQVTSVKDLGYNAWVLEMEVPGSVAAGSAASTAKQTISVSAGCYNLSAVVRHVAGNSSVRTSIRVNWTGDGGSYMVPAYTDTNWHAGNLINFKIPSGVSQATVATYTTKPTSSSITGVWQWDTIAVNPVVCPAQ